MTITDLLDRSAATPAFREAADRFLQTGRGNDRVAFAVGAPPVKVERALTKALIEYPAEPIESIEFRARSGCESFAGDLLLRTASDTRRVSFHWDCRWRAEQEGWRDWFGFPDQARAAREFGHDCFRTWEEQPATKAAAVQTPA